jgi:hypothetical protein
MPGDIRKLPAPPQLNTAPAQAVTIHSSDTGRQPQLEQSRLLARRDRHCEIKPLAPERFKIQFTIDRRTYDALRQIQDMMRHTIPDGDLAVIFSRALSLLLLDVSRKKWADTTTQRTPRSTDLTSRHVPAAVKREVWRRDGGQCAFRGQHGRCSETGFLEFHHLVPYARRGATTTANLELRCRAHNVYEAEKEFGRLEF